MAGRRRFGFEQRDELCERYFASFHFRPRIGVGIARIQAANEIVGQSGLDFVAPERLEGAAENYAAEVPKDGAWGRRCPNFVSFHSGATVFTLFLPHSAPISTPSIGV